MEQKRKFLILLFMCIVIFVRVDAQPNWSFNASNYEYSMTLTGVISINDTLVENTPGVIVGAFNESSACVGMAVARYYGSVEKYRLPLMIHSNQNGEEIHLKAYIPGQDSELEISNTIQFQIDGSMGNFVDPVVWKKEADTVTPITEDDMSASISIYPNPVVEQINVRFPNNGGTYKIMLIDLTGRILKEQTCNQEIESLDVGQMTQGTYFLHLESHSGIITRKIIKK